ncbi:hypothetical protein KCU81_g4401, partial [Aureobasidium melanogenum]|uniref:C3H1-type domain-containing protein n=1 Tax=Aureobasidium melanogenum (strain CBS 110374) TaxID=1043003 RepID=A0A074W4D2_AURM1
MRPIWIFQRLSPTSSDLTNLWFLGFQLFKAQSIAAYLNSTRQDALDELTLTYGKLLEDYRILRSDYEEEKESREKYKKLARGQDKNPFVLVLIDADGYVFEDSLIKGGAEGGIRAANILHDTIQDRLSRRGHEYENCKVMVRAYTNLAGLSKTLARAGLVGHEARSLSPFCSNFTRAHDLFDFVDAGDKKENADNKIQKITRIRGSSFSPEFNRLGLDIDSLNGLFHNNPLDSLDARRIISRTPVAHSQQSIMPNGHSGAVSNHTPVCTHYLRGICKFGSGCKKCHSSSKDSWRSNDYTAGRDSAQRDPTQASFFRSSSDFGTPIPSNEDIGAPQSSIALPHRSATIQAFPSSLPATSFAHPSSCLPKQTPENANLIPINSIGHRLDFLLPTPSSEDWKAYNARIAPPNKKLCNEYQLKGYCTKGDSCGWDHSSIPDNIRLVLKHFVHSYPCGRKGNCRLKNCNMGHICFRDRCDTTKKHGTCRLNYTMHEIDPVVADWVPAESNIEVYNPDSFGMTSGENNHSERDGLSRAVSEAPQNENDIDPLSYTEPHPDDLD